MITCDIVSVLSSTMGPAAFCLGALLDMGMPNTPVLGARILMKVM